MNSACSRGEGEKCAVVVLFHRLIHGCARLRAVCVFEFCVCTTLSYPCTGEKSMGKGRRSSGAFKSQLKLSKYHDIHDHNTAYLSISKQKKRSEPGGGPLGPPGLRPKCRAPLLCVRSPLCSAHMQCEVLLDFAQSAPENMRGCLCTQLTITIAKLYIHENVK